MKKKAINTYQVSFAKSLDISKDFKQRNSQIFNKIIHSYKLYISIKTLFDNEDAFIEILNPLNLDNQAILAELVAKLEDFKFLNLKILIRIFIYLDGTWEVIPTLPSNTNLLKYFLNFNSGAINPKYKHAAKILLTKVRKKTEKEEFFLESGDFRGFTYSDLVSLAKLKVSFSPELAKLSFFNVINTLIGSIKSMSDLKKVR